MSIDWCETWIKSQNIFTHTHTHHIAHRTKHNTIIDRTHLKKRRDSIEQICIKQWNENQKMNIYKLNGQGRKKHKQRESGGERKKATKRRRNETLIKKMWKRMATVAIAMIVISVVFVRQAFYSLLKIDFVSFARSIDRLSLALSSPSILFVVVGLFLAWNKIIRHQTLCFDCCSLLITFTKLRIKLPYLILNAGKCAKLTLKIYPINKIQIKIANMCECI